MATITDAPTITDGYTDFVLGLRVADLPEDVSVAAKVRLLDWIGVTLAASSSRLADILVATFDGFGGSPHSSVVGRGIRLPVHDAALINASMAQALDYDDCLDSCLHPAAPVAAGVLGYAEWRKSSGSEVLASFVAGYEVAAQIARRIGRTLQKQSFYVTGVLGGFGVAAGVGRLAGLPPATLKHALGLAGTQSGGVMAGFGTMSKPLMTGRAAMSGVMAALLAEKGFTSTQQILDGERGIAAAYVGQDLIGTEKMLGRDWEILTSQIRPFACCGGHHAAIECAIELHRQSTSDRDQIKRVLVDLAPQTILGAGIARPIGGDAGRLSAQYTVAVGLINGAVGPEQFEDEMVARPEMQALADKVELLPTYERVTEGRVRLIMADGRTIEKHVDWGKGSPGNPMSQPDVLAKFIENAEQKLGTERATRIANLIEHLEDVKDAGQLLSLSS